MKPLLFLSFLLLAACKEDQSQSNSLPKAPPLTVVDQNGNVIHPTPTGPFPASPKPKPTDKKQSP